MVLTLPHGTASVTASAPASSAAGIILNTPSGTIRVLAAGHFTADVANNGAIRLRPEPGGELVLLFTNRAGSTVITADSGELVIGDDNSSPRPAPPQPSLDHGFNSLPFPQDIPPLSPIPGLGLAFFDMTAPQHSPLSSDPFAPLLYSSRTEPVRPDNAHDLTTTPNSGDNYYIVPGAVISEHPGGGIDTVEASIDYTLPDNVEIMILSGTANLNGTGNALDNTLTGNSGDNTLDGAAGADTMIGGAGDDTYIVDDAGDVVSEAAGEGIDTIRTSVSLTLAANVENLVLTGTADLNGTGNALANVITGNSGNNTLDGAAGADTMIGGAGDDTYIVDDAGDVISEAAGEGIDTIRTSITLALAANVENLVLTGNANLSGTGNALDNVITGNSGDNVLYGLGGNDTLYGLAGNDTLDGGTGADTMAGGNGDDVYYVDDIGDVITENSNEGTDTVYASIIHALTVNVENLILTGSADLSGTGNALDNVITGNSGNNTLYGLDGNDTLSGGAGNDTLDGGTGADTMAGGSGDDFYYVDNAGDVVSEGAGLGIDTVSSSISYTLTANVEKLILTGSGNLTGAGNSDDNEITGNSGNNTLYGLDGADTLYGLGGNDTLDGGAGADTMVGGTGNDLYYVDDLGDVIIEVTGEGTDRVYVNVSGYTMADNLEILIANTSDPFLAYGNSDNNTLYGSTGSSTLYGGDGNDTLSGNSSSGIDYLYGGNGNDYLVGGAGYNTLVGGYGADRFYLTGSGNTIVYSQLDVLNGDGGDTIIGFWPIDRIAIEIPGLTAGVLSSANFINDTGTDSFNGFATGSTSPQVILTNWNGTSYNQGTNYLWIDYDGSGAQQAYQIADIGTETATASQITVT